MAYPAYLTDVRSPSDGYLFWPEWMKTLFLDGMGWSIKELFWHWLGLVALTALGLLFLARYLKKRGMPFRKRWPVGLAGWVLLLLLPFLDMFWIRHQFDRACATMAGFHLHEKVYADGYLDGPLLSDMVSVYRNTKEPPRFPEWQVYVPSPPPQLNPRDLQEDADRAAQGLPPRKRKPGLAVSYRLGDEHPWEFRFVESATDGPSRGWFLHYEWKGDQVLETLRPQPEARYAYIWNGTAVRGRSVGLAVSMTETRLYEISSGRVVAREVYFHSYVGFLVQNTLGRFGQVVDSCPFGDQESVKRGYFTFYVGPQGEKKLLPRARFQKYSPILVTVALRQMPTDLFDEP